MTRASQKWVTRCWGVFNHLFGSRQTVNLTLPQSHLTETSHDRPRHSEKNPNLKVGRWCWTLSPSLSESLENRHHDWDSSLHLQEILKKIWYLWGRKIWYLTLYFFSSELKPVFSAEQVVLHVLNVGWTLQRPHLFIISSCDWKHFVTEMIWPRGEVSACRAETEKVGLPTEE